MPEKAVRIDLAHEEVSLKKALKIVERGGQVVLMRDGSPVARIAPLHEITPDLMTPEERKEAWARFDEARAKLGPRLTLSQDEIVAMIREERDS